MKVDEKATRRARERHAAGVLRLHELFRFDPALALSAGVQTGRWTPYRPKKGCPPARSADARARHRQRKAAHTARRRNRP